MICYSHKKSDGEIPEQLTALVSTHISSRYCTRAEVVAVDVRILLK